MGAEEESGLSWHFTPDHYFREWSGVRHWTGTRAQVQGVDSVVSSGSLLVLLRSPEHRSGLITMCLVVQIWTSARFREGMKERCFPACRQRLELLT